jgi:hypothetical protein
MIAFDPTTESFYAAVTGGRLAGRDFQVATGVTLQPTYAHVFASYMVAFKRPEAPGKHHPGPWHPAGHDLGFECEFEVFVDSSAAAGSLGRLNVGWLCVALLRLKSGLKLRAPVVANRTFTAAPAQDAPGLAMLPMETSSTQWPPKQTIRHVLAEDDLEWLRTQYPKALCLMSDATFARSFGTYDGAAWQPSIPAAVLSLCSALEALMRPGRRDMTKRLARLVAAYLSEEPVLRDMHYQMVLDVFAYRGGVAHAAKWLPIEIWHATQLLVRPVFIQCLETGHLPDPDALETEWHRVQPEPWKRT